MARKRILTGITNEMIEQEGKDLIYVLKELELKIQI